MLAHTCITSLTSGGIHRSVVRHDQNVCVVKPSDFELLPEPRIKRFKVNMDVQTGSTQIRIWQTSVDNVGESVRDLSADERQRAAKFHREADRRRWIAARIWLRRTLGQELNIDPAEIEFEYGPHGKPSIANVAADCEFNLSHAGQSAVVAVTSVPVGVDIEPLRELADMSSVSEIVLSDKERRQLDQLPPGQRPKLFFEFWTSKEAIVKSRGQGVGEIASLDLFDESVVQLTSAGWKQADSKSWQVIPLELQAPFVGAVAVTDVTHPIELIYVKPAD